MNENASKQNKQKQRPQVVRNERLVKAENVAVARRSIWYILRTLLLLFAALVVCYSVFTEAMYVSNIYIIVTDGMERRADCILSSGGALELKDYFDSHWLTSDTALYAGKYDGFHVEAYDYRIELKSLAVYPWSTRAKLVAVERIPTISAEAFDENNEQTVPAWDNAKYEITMEKLDGRWIITRLDVLEYDPEPDPAATPDYSQLETDIPHR